MLCLKKWTEWFVSHQFLRITIPVEDASVHKYNRQPYEITNEEDIKTEVITVNKGDVATLVYDGTIKEGDEFDPRELYVHFDGVRVVAAMANYFASLISTPFGTIRDKGWRNCSQWVFEPTSGEWLSIVLIFMGG